MLAVASCTIRKLNDKNIDCKRFVGEQLLTVLCYCTKNELKQACGSLAELAKDCQDPHLAEQCRKALAEVWCRQPELKEPAMKALAAWAINFPEHHERIQDVGAALTHSYSLLK